MKNFARKKWKIGNQKMKDVARKKRKILQSKNKNKPKNSEIAR